MISHLKPPIISVKASLPPKLAKRSDVQPYSLNINFRDIIDYWHIYVKMALGPFRNVTKSIKSQKCKGERIAGCWGSGWH